MLNQRRYHHNSRYLSYKSTTREMTEMITNHESISLFRRSVAGARQTFAPEKAQLETKCDPLSLVSYNEAGVDACSLHAYKLAPYRKRPIRVYVCIHGVCHAGMLLACIFSRMASNGTNRRIYFFFGGGGGDDELLLNSYNFEKEWDFGKGRSEN